MSPLDKLLEKPGDYFLEYVTKNHNKVYKGKCGNEKFSATVYKTGRITKTYTYNPEDKDLKLIDKLF